MVFTPSVIHHHLRTSEERHNLLVQFIYSELMESFEIIKCIEKLKLSDESLLNEGVAENLYHLLLKLVGNPKSSSHYFSNEKSGTFSKIKSYSALLSEIKSIQKKEISYLNQVGNQMWILSLQACDACKSLLQEQDINKTLLFLIKRMIHALKVYLKIIKQFLMHYKQDENVLFFLLQNQEKLDAMYHENFVASLFKKMFFRSLKRAELFIYTRYSIRGFSHLLPLIQMKFEKL
jgi:hypothetical protein